jgi:hypothetical protein
LVRNRDLIGFSKPVKSGHGCGASITRIPRHDLGVEFRVVFARSSIHPHESMLFGQLMATLKQGEIALADRGCGPFPTATEVEKRPCAAERFASGWPLPGMRVK